jgi:RimJ/RimL family protein N-acetyltransferase
MLDRPNYGAVETLRNGCRFDIRAFRSSDRERLLAAVGRAGTLSLYRRFFTVKSGFTDAEMAFFLNPDFVDHVVMIALVQEADCRRRPYVVVGPGKAEIAFVVIDEYQNEGIGLLLLRHLAVIARDAGLQTLIAEVLPENTPMLKVFEKSGLAMTTTCDPEVGHVALALN